MGKEAPAPPPRPGPSPVQLAKHVTPHALRGTFATHVLRSGYDIRTVRELMGHQDIRTTQIYTHVLNRGGFGVIRPLDYKGSKRAQ